MNVKLRARTKFQGEVVGDVKLSLCGNKLKLRIARHLSSESSTPRFPVRSGKATTKETTSSYPAPQIHIGLVFKASYPFSVRTHVQALYTAFEGFSNRSWTAKSSWSDEINSVEGELVDPLVDPFLSHEVLHALLAYSVSIKDLEEFLELVYCTND